jgi:hypothetical protein
MPQSRSFTFDDPYAYQAVVRSAEVEVLVTGTGKFEAEMVLVDLDHLWMAQGWDSLPRLARTANDPRRAKFEFVSGWNQAPLQYDGAEVSAGEIVVAGLGSVTRERTPDHTNGRPCRCRPNIWRRRERRSPVENWSRPWIPMSSDRQKRKCPD